MGVGASQKSLETALGSVVPCSRVDPDGIRPDPSSQPSVPLRFQDIDAIEHGPVQRRKVFCYVRLHCREDGPPVTGPV